MQLCMHKAAPHIGKVQYNLMLDKQAGKNILTCNRPTGQGIAYKIYDICILCSFSLFTLYVDSNHITQRERFDRPILTIHMSNDAIPCKGAPLGGNNTSNFFSSYFPKNVYVVGRINWDCKFNNVEADLGRYHRACAVRMIDAAPRTAIELKRSLRKCSRFAYSEVINYQEASTKRISLP
jgi:hypothetical protein